jgi:hypothetical protein
MNDLDWKKPALIGGLIAGLGSLVPVFNLANLCLCAWAWVGGIVAARMLTTRSVRTLTYADGARIGLAAGVIGGLIYFLINTPILTWQMDRLIRTISTLPQFPPEWTETFLQVQQNMVTRVCIALASSLLYGLVLAAFTVLGGVLGVAIFEKRQADPYSNAQGS